MEFILLRSFVAAAELGSLSRAAVALGIAQSAVSRHLNALEAEIGARLLHRTGRGVKLTDTGTSMLPRAQALLEGAQTMLDEARQVMVLPRGAVSIGIVPAWSHAIAGRLVTWQRENYPEIRLKVLEGYSGDIEEWLASGRIDVGVFNRYRSRAHSEAVVTHQMQLVMRASDPRGSQPVRLKALALLPLALPMRPNSLRTILDELCLRAGIELDVRLDASSSVVIKDAVMRGDLYSVLPPHAIAQERQLGTLKCVDIIDPEINQMTMVEVTAKHPLSAAAKAVWRAIPGLMKSAQTQC